MEKMVKDLLNKYEKFEFENLSQDEKRDELKILKESIKFIQHERLIHLLVTLFFAGLVLAFFTIFYFSLNFAFGVLTLLVMVVEVFYIKHYYVLENGTQKLYKIFILNSPARLNFA